MDSPISAEATLLIAKTGSALFTGGNSGIGKAIATAMGCQGAKFETDNEYLITIVFGLCKLLFPA